MFGEWFKRRRTRASTDDAAELVKAIPRVLGRYAELMEKHGGTYMDESWLPLDKPGMKSMLKLALASEKDEKHREWLKAGWLMLADFQPGIGQTPLKMPELPEDFAAAKNPKFMRAFEHWSTVQNRVFAEMQANKAEMDAFVATLPRS